MHPSTAAGCGLLVADSEASAAKRFVALRIFHGSRTAEQAATGFPGGSRVALPSEHRRAAAISFSGDRSDPRRSDRNLAPRLASGIATVSRLNQGPRIWLKSPFTERGS